jgi:hypothetical protein
LPESQNFGLSSNEDAEDISYRVDESVRVTWIRGWEVVLPDD